MLTRTPKQGVLGKRYKEAKTPTNGGSFKTRNITPSRNGDFKGATEGDRYVPQHNQDHFDYAKVAFEEDIENMNRSASLPNSPSGYKAPSISLLRGQSEEQLDMYVYRKNAAPAVNGKKGSNILYKCMNPSSSVRVAKRVYPKIPTQTLDAPGLLGDFYFNLLDWSSQQLLVVAIRNKVYTYDAHNAQTTLFANFESVNANVTLLKFSKDGNYLAIGLDVGSIGIFDVATKVCKRKFAPGSSWRICSTAWTTAGVIAFGNRGGVVQTHDPRQRLSFLTEHQDHEAEVCGLAWVCNEEFLVSGGADANVNVYDRRNILDKNSQYLYQLQDHVATVKAITECPFIHGKIVATGGGSNDGSVRFWNLSNGQLFQTINIGNQVSGIVFDHYYREMATSHGGNSNCVKVWKYSPMTNDFSTVHEIDCNSRVLSMTKSSCGEFIAIINDAEEVSIFNLFQKDERYHENMLNQRTKELNLKFSGVRQRIR